MAGNQSLQENRLNIAWNCYHSWMFSKLGRNSGNPVYISPTGALEGHFPHWYSPCFLTDLYRLLSLVKGVEQIFMLLAMTVVLEAAVLQSPPYTTHDLLFTREINQKLGSLLLECSVTNGEPPPYKKDWQRKQGELSLWQKVKFIVLLLEPEWYLFLPLWAA